jgi:hypothetical protein
MMRAASKAGRRRGLRRGHRPWAWLCGLWLLLVASTALAAPPPPSWLADHIAFDIAGVTGWRAAWADERNPGFQILGGGGEVNLGLEFDSGLGVLVGSRVLFGSTLGAVGEELYADASGQLIGQLRVADWVRLGLGVSVGRLWRCCSSDLDMPQTSTLVAGGFARVGFDWLSRSATLVRALSFWLRLGVDGHPNNGSDSLLPTSSMNLTLSLGFRL